MRLVKCINGVFDPTIGPEWFKAAMLVGEAFPEAGYTYTTETEVWSIDGALLGFSLVEFDFSAYEGINNERAGLFMASRFEVGEMQYEPNSYDKATDRVCQSVALIIDLSNHTLLSGPSK